MEEDSTLERRLKPVELAELWGVDKSMVYRLIRRKNLRAVLIGTHLRIPLEAVYAYENRPPESRVPEAPAARSRPRVPPRPVLRGSEEMKRMFLDAARRVVRDEDAEAGPSGNGSEAQNSDRPKRRGKAKTR
jgi:excisionase family DNA binding protein